jgi:hypothetical protein
VSRGVGGGGHHGRGRAGEETARITGGGTRGCGRPPYVLNRSIYIYILYLYITPGCIQYRECTQAEPTRQEHLVRANRPTQAESTLRFRPSRTLPTECYNFRTRPAVASSYIEVAITTYQQLQLQHTSSCNHFVYIFLTDIWVELYSSCNHT